MTDIRGYLGETEHQEGSGLTNAFAQAAHRVRLTVGAPIKAVLCGAGKFKGFIAAEIVHAKEGSALLETFMDTMRQQEVSFVRVPVSNKPNGLRR